MSVMIQEMISDLEAEAREAGLKIIADAKGEAKKIINEGKEEGKKAIALSLRRANQKLKLEEAKIASSANFYVKKEVIKAKESVIADLFVKLEKMLKTELESDSAKIVFKKLAEEALSKFSNQKVKVLVRNEDKNLAQEILNEKGIEGSIKANLNCIGGLKVESENGRIVVDNTIETRLQKIQTFYQPEIVANLFGDK